MAMLKCRVRTSDDLRGSTSDMTARIFFFVPLRVLAGWKCLSLWGFVALKAGKMHTSCGILRSGAEKI